MEQLRVFVPEFLDQNPLSSLALVGSRGSKAHVISRLGGARHAHVRAWAARALSILTQMHKLEAHHDCAGELSLLHALEAAAVTGRFGRAVTAAATAVARAEAVMPLVTGTWIGAGSGSPGLRLQAAR